MFIRTMMAAVLAAGMAHAQDIDPEAGRDLFMTYCWQCHGMEARGNGPMAEMLAIETPDLTTLARRNDGVFPVAAVAMQIDGRAPLLAHGGIMPLFGDALDADRSVALKLSSGQPMMTPLPLANVVVYLESLQAE